MTSSNTDDSDSATPSPLLNAVVEQTAELGSWLGDLTDAQAAAIVPTCPDWRLPDLLGHIGATQRWVARMVAERIDDPMTAFGLGWETLPEERDHWVGWLAESADRAAAAFADVGSEAAVWDPSGGNDGISFWSQRMLGEVAVHKFDAALTIGADYRLAPGLAAHAIDDWFANMTSVGWAANVPGFAEAMRGDGQEIAWVAPDADRAWAVQRTDAPLVLRASRAADFQPGGGPDDVVVEGPAFDLLRVLSRRGPVDQATTCSVRGNRSELDHLIDHMTWVGA